MFKVVAIDGPAASGKSTLSKLLANKLNFVHIDSGAIYRTYTLALLKKFGRDLKEVELKAKVSETNFTIEDLFVKIVVKNNVQTNLINGIEVKNELREPKVTQCVKVVADNKNFRIVINSLIKNLANEYNLVVDGRDISSLVFPESPYKFYIHANIKKRAMRRLHDLNQLGMESELLKLEKEIEQRDKDDSTREYGCLTKAPDAILIDNSIDEPNSIVNQMENLIKKVNYR